MAYQVLARKWRPRDFSQVVGQAHVLRALANALDSDRLHHAYLFTGTRGVGKTTLARVFAKCLNCETGVSSRPCGTCGACRELDEGRFVDLIEVDAASRTKVDETRELLDNVQYAPTKGRYKVYLIDEVHMFSGHSFNALLKTLEEPPPHVKFLLATTDPKRLPVTILSRCLQLSLKRLGVDQIEQQLQTVVAREGLQAESRALRLIAIGADGSLRDALSLLDQAIAYCGGGLEEAGVAAMLGTLDAERVLELAAALVAGDGRALIGIARELAELAPDFGEVLASLLSLLRRVALVQTLGEGAAELEHDPKVAALAARLSRQDCQLFYQIGLLARRDLPLAPDPQAGFEMSLLRMLAFRPAGMGASPTSEVASRALPGGATAAANPSPAPLRNFAAAPRVVREEPSAGITPARMPAGRHAPESPELVASAEPAPRGPRPAPATLDWSRLVGALPGLPMVRELARNCALRSFDGELLKLVVAPQFDSLTGERQVRALEQAVQEAWGYPLRLRVEVERDSGVATPAEQYSAEKRAQLDAARRAIESDPNVQALQARFGASVERVETLGPEVAGKQEESR